MATRKGKKTALELALESASATPKAKARPAVEGMKRYQWVTPDSVAKAAEDLVNGGPGALRTREGGAIEVRLSRTRVRAQEVGHVPIYGDNGPKGYVVFDRTAAGDHEKQVRGAIRGVIKTLQAH